MDNIKAIKSDRLSSTYEPRFVIVDSNNNVLDDAQGYGYKTAQKAYAAYSYKHRDKSKDKEKAAKRRNIQKWLDDNPAFVRALDDTALDILKGQYGPDATVNAALVREVLKELDLETDFSAGEILKVWKKY